jgi:putative Holliday junction resolvase
MNALGLDFGDRRIGVAASDPLGVTAQPITVIERSSLSEDIARIREIATGRGTDRIVVGLPLNMDGSVGPQARRAKRFAGRLERELEIRVELWDERLSTVEAERSLIAAEKRRAARRGLRDAVAAALFLQSYLEARRREGDG